MMFCRLNSIISTSIKYEMFRAESDKTCQMRIIENFTVLLRDVKEHLNKQRDMPCP